jgi:ABC-2 type transport system ATP-binding protein
MSGGLALEIRGLARSYGTTRALDGLNLAVPRGAIAGFVGLNGAGKTTTLRILLGMARPDSGVARALGLDALDPLGSLAIRRRTAFVPERKELFPYMRVRDAVAFTRSFYPGWRGDREARLAQRFGIDYDRRVTEISKGTLAKLHLLLAFSRGAELILLDEPTDGLDPLGVEVALSAMVSAAAEDGATILFSSHRLDEMEQVADYLCMIHKGRTLMSGPADDLKQACRRVVVGFADDAAPRVPHFAGHGPVANQGRTLTLLASGNSDSAIATARALGAHSIDVQALSMRELFLELVKGENPR